MSGHEHWHDWRERMRATRTPEENAARDERVKARKEELVMPWFDLRIGFRASSLSVAAEVQEAMLKLLPYREDMVSELRRSESLGRGEGFDGAHQRLARAYAQIDRLRGALSEIASGECHEGHMVLLSRIALDPWRAEQETVIDADEFEAARRDPAFRKFVADAEEYVGRGRR